MIQLDTKELISIERILVSIDIAGCLGHLDGVDITCYVGNSPCVGVVATINKTSLDS